ncbi:cupin domain-containing protein [Antarctobacter sp.]|uniref:cupin domain-containing protein n=1 Tax=Antarctobacter sp. TaxID=1872577 RepID=UPI003A8E3A4C
MNESLLGPDAFEWLGVHYRTILTTEDSGGTLSITDSVSPPGSGPPRHIHHDADESFVMLTGDAEFWLAGKTVSCGPGGTVFVPRGTEHTFRVISDVPARHLVILTPGGFERFFVDMAAGDFRIPEDMAQIEQIAAGHNLTFTGPPLGADLQET